MARGCVSGVPGLRRLFRARGSQRPGRLPTRWYATAVSMASINAARSFGRAASIFGANAVNDLLGSFETNLARLDALFAGGHGHDRAE